MDNKNKKHILVVSQYFYPEQFRVNDICEEWIRRGYRVTVLTGIPNYPTGKFYPGHGYFKNNREKYKGIDIIRIPIVPRGTNSITLALNYASFVISGFFWSVFTTLKVDRVFIYEVSPMTQALPGVWFAKRKKIPCDIYVLDLWPENFSIITGIRNKLVIKYLTKMVTYIYNHCQKIFVSSPKFIESIQGKGDFSNKLSYWPQFAEDFYRPQNSKMTDSSLLKIIFAGNIGYAQGLDILPVVAKNLKEKGIKVIFVIVGDGRYKAEFISEVSDYNVEEYFDFKNKVPATEIPILLSENNISLISLSKNDIFSMTLPAKLQSIMACGHPILVVADGEVGKVVLEAECGLVGRAGDVEALVDNIEEFNENKDLLDFYGDNAKKYYDANFSKKYLMDQMDIYLNE